MAVLVLSWNGRTLLQSCLPPLLNQTYVNYQVVLIDNGSTDDSVSWVRQHFPAVQVIVNEQNLGYSQGINVGLRQIEADVTVLLNNDVLVHPNWLAELLRPFAQDPTVGIAGSKLLFPEGSIQHLGAELTYPRANSHHFHYQEPDKDQITSLQDVPYVTGASMAVRRAVLEKIGLLDEAFSPFYYEEVDFCTRAKAAGFRVVVAPKSVATHDESATMSQASGLKLHTLHKNRLCYVLKHYSTDQFLQDFVPAEAAYLAQHPGFRETNILRLVFLETAVPRPPLPPEATPEQVTAVQNALLLLHNTAIHAQDSIEPPPALTEFEFPTSESPLGALVARLRRAWSNIAAKWLVRSLLQQQGRHNHHFLRQIDYSRSQESIQSLEIAHLLPELLAAQKKQQALEAELAELRTRLQKLESTVTESS